MYSPGMIILFLVLALSACLTQFATDIYLPSFPSMAKALQVPLSTIQGTLSIYLLGVCMSQVVYGPVSESIGRKKPLVFGIGLMLVGSLLCAFSPSAEMLYVSRLVQGVGAGACSALWRTIFRDQFSGKDLAKYSSYLVIFIIFCVPAAPALGGLLEETLGWRSNFGFMAFLGGGVLLLLLLAFKDTLKPQNRTPLSVKGAAQKYMMLIKSPTFMGVGLAVFFTYGGAFTWYAIGPVLLMEHRGVTPTEFGYLNLIMAGVGYGLGGILNGRLVPKLGIETMMRLGWLIIIFSASTILTQSFFGDVSKWGIVIPIAFIYFGSCFVWPNAFATAFTPFGHIAGYAGALYSSLQLGGGSALGALSAYLPSTVYVLCAMIVTTSFLGWMIFEGVVVRNK